MHPVEAFIRALVAKWYIILMIGAFSVLYSTYKALNEKGVIKKAEFIFVDAMSQIKGAAQNCMPLITDLNVFWKCLGQPHKYTSTTEDEALENTLKVHRQSMQIVDPTNTANTEIKTTPNTSDTSSSSSSIPPTILP